MEDPAAVDDMSNPEDDVKEEEEDGSDGKEEDGDDEKEEEDRDGGEVPEPEKEAAAAGYAKPTHRPRRGQCTSFSQQALSLKRVLARSIVRAVGSASHADRWVHRSTGHVLVEPPRRQRDGGGGDPAEYEAVQPGDHLIAADGHNAVYLGHGEVVGIFSEDGGDDGVLTLRSLIGFSCYGAQSVELVRYRWNTSTASFSRQQVLARVISAMSQHRSISGGGGGDQVFFYQAFYQPPSRLSSHADAITERRVLVEGDTRALLPSEEARIDSAPATLRFLF